MKAVSCWLAAENAVRSWKTSVRISGRYGVHRRRFQSSTAQLF